MTAPVSRRFFPLFLFFLLSGAFPASSSETGDITSQLQQQAVESRLGLDPGWLSLLHYRKHMGRYESEADDPDYFLSTGGKSNPREELLANIAGMLADPASFKDENKHPQCVFPARFHWLKQKLAIPSEELPSPLCSRFQEWQAQFNAHSLTLVFPAALINSPSSMFGHTFIRVDPENPDEKNRLLSVSVNYAAAMDENENDLLMIFKGLFGGYQGETSIWPYHLKVKQYSDLESRDIWEYQLDFTPEETRQFIRHIWEVGFVNFDYYYIDENCAYRILALLEAVKPEINSIAGFQSIAIPADTIRALEEAGVVQQVVFRPSLSTTVDAYTSTMNGEQLDWTKKLALGESTVADFNTVSLGDAEKKQVLETAYEVVRYRKTTGRINKDEAEELWFPMLMQRSRLPAGSGLPEVSTPETNSASGHRSTRLKLAPGYSTWDGTGQPYGLLQWRLAYHSLTDPLPGYTPGAQIEFLKTEVRLYEGGLSQLELLKVVNVTSLSPQKIYISPLSWSAEGGVKRIRLDGEDFLAGYARAGFGKTLEYSSSLFYGLGTLELRADDDLDKGHSFGTGIEAGWLYFGDKSQGQITVQGAYHFSGSNYEDGGLSWKHVFNTGKNHSLSLEVSRLKGGEQIYNDARIVMRVFY